MTSSPPPAAVTVGIDIGAESTKVVLGSEFSCEIVRSEAGLHTHPTAVSFSNKLRQIGETAQQKGKNGIIHLNRLIGLKKEDFLQDFYTFDFEKTDTTETATASPTCVTVQYNGQERTFSASALLAMLLSSVQNSVKATMDRLKPDFDSTNGIQYLITVPPASAEEDSAMIHQQLLDAAFAAGLDNVQIVQSPTAYAAAYQRKFPQFGTETEQVLMIVDMGHAQTCVSLVKFAPIQPAEGEESSNTESTMTVLTSKCLDSLGAASVDIRLWHHFQSTLPQLKNVTQKSRAGNRLLQGTHKLKKLLSQLPDGKVTVENVGENDTDVSLQCTRNTLAELCEEDAQALKELLQSALKEATNVDAVEVVGGGCRIPWVQAAIQEVLAETNHKDMTLSRSLDDTSAALGAALVGEKPKPQEGLLVAVPEPTDADSERRNKLRDEEMAMAALDLDEKVKANICNQMEAQILELRSAKHGKHGALLPTDNTLDDYLNGLEDWLFSEDADQSNCKAMETKLQEMQAKTKELCADYYNAVQQEHAAKEKEMEEAAKQAQLEERANGFGEEDDHDNRRLPKKRRMEIVMKNKEEANELFKDGNWRFAAARYTKALTHCAKFVDLSPDDIKEVTDLKVTLNLNLALAYSKMGNQDQCLRVCNEAIALNEASAKAYYRRASVFYEKKRWDDAKQDITKAKQLAETDKAIQKLGERIDLQLKKQKQKEKKMASKMFG